MKSSDDSIELRSIQQYLYCPHRWGLMENDCAWAENVFVCRGNLAHARVEEGTSTLFRGARQERSVHVYNDEWGLFGVADCIEFKRENNPKNCVTLGKYEGHYSVHIVEYKVTAPKDGGYRREDAMQLLGQKICVDGLFGCDANTYFFYSDTHRREYVVFENRDYEFLRFVLDEMREFRQSGIIPPIKERQYCGGCSLKDICLPSKPIKSGKS